jgi:peptidoglycan-associated lipoprotein
MKRTTLFLLLIVALGTVLFLNGCPKKQEPVAPPPAPIETQKPEVIKDTTPPPPPPKEMLREEQLQTVYFDFDKYNLRPDAKASLDANFALLQKYTDVIVKIEGHCDERGTVEYNLSLGEKRAQSVMDYLSGLGIAPSRMTVISYGKERPVDAGHNEGAWSKNRRSEFRVVSQ